jgi:hypothetical protein
MKSLSICQGSRILILKHTTKKLPLLYEWLKKQIFIFLCDVEYGHGHEIGQFVKIGQFVSSLRYKKLDHGLDIQTKEITQG